MCGNKNPRICEVLSEEDEEGETVKQVQITSPSLNKMKVWHQNYSAEN